MSKDVATRGGRKPVSMTHTAAMVGVGVVGAIIAFWVLGTVLGTILGIFWFAVKIVVIIGLIAGAFWVVEKVRR